MTTFAELDALSTTDLRDRAFDLAKQRRDLGFFIDLSQHLPSAGDAEQGDDSLGDIGPQIDDYFNMWHELKGHEYGDREPLIRARFIDYLMDAEK
ncbi:hypothetical protein [Hamadaea tsunoensis]|uniref:hypothetical protein n=1 Tax=Hamadaea tsunoensis TaxID=53368 RepID=UPI0004806148|nr:hypothetical protein [Hamadaea tsunoensis]